MTVAVIVFKVFNQATNGLECYPQPLFQISLMSCDMFVSVWDTHGHRSGGAFGEEFIATAEGGAQMLH